MERDVEQVDVLMGQLLTLSPVWKRVYRPMREKKWTCLNWFRKYWLTAISRRARAAASLLHHFHHSFPSVIWIAYLPQECDAGTTHAIRGLQADMKTQAIDCRHRGFR
jgi:hypothetical protein